jgi:hypothetical protein
MDSESLSEIRKPFVNATTIFSTYSLEGAGLSVHGRTSYGFLLDTFLAPGGAFRVGRTMPGGCLLAVSLPLTINGVTYNQFASFCWEPNYPGLPG